MTYARIEIAPSILASNFASLADEIGKVEDVDVNFESDRIDSIVLHEGGRFRGKERIIPYSMVETVGERVILRKESESLKRGMR